MKPSGQGRTEEGTKTKKEEEGGPGEGKAGRGREARKEDGGKRGGREKVERKSPGEEDFLVSH